MTADRPEPFEFGTGYRKIDSLRDNLSAVLAALASGRPLPVTPGRRGGRAAAIEAAYASCTAAAGRR